MGSSDLGAFGLIWSVHRDIPKIDRIILSRPDRSAEQAVAERFPGVSSGSCVQMELLTEQLAAAMHGVDIPFDLKQVRLDRCPPFQQKVLQVEYRIPRGQVTTYQRLARRIGKPSAVRAVGNALAANPFPIFIPCHRAVRSDLTVGGFQGGPVMKRILLGYEGHVFDHKMRLINPEMAY